MIAAASTELFDAYELAQPDASEYGVLRFYTLDSASVAATLEKEWLAGSRSNRLPFPFRVSPREMRIIHQPHDAPLLVLGRSGTGKTTCALSRMYMDFLRHWGSGTGKDHGAPLHQMFVTRNSVLRTDVMRTFYDQLMCCGRVPVVTGLANRGTVEIKKMQYPFSVPEGGFPADPFVPKSLTGEDSVPVANWPLFLSSQDLYRVIDSSLPGGRRCFPDAEAAGTAGGSTTDAEFGSLSSLDHFGSDATGGATPGADRAAGPARRAAGRTTGPQPLSMGRTLITYEVFDRTLWMEGRGSLPAAALRAAKMSAAVVWNCFKSHIKGSAEAVAQGRPLSREQFTSTKVMGKTRVQHTEDERHAIYDAYEKYVEKLQDGAHPCYDEMDIVLNLHDRITQLGKDKAKDGADTAQAQATAGKVKGGKKAAAASESAAKDAATYGWRFLGNVCLDSITIDETQDFTQAEMLLFLRLCKGPNESFIAGDTAQAIARGVAFRFKDVTSMLHNLQDKAKQGVRLLEGRVVTPEPHKLAHNYRSHSELLDMAAGIVQLLSLLFPESIDTLKPDQGVFDGPKPRLLLTSSVEELTLLCGGPAMLQSGARRVDFGARQCIMVRTQESRASMPPEFGNAVVLTVPESKGLEMDDVLPYNFWRDSPAKKEWRLLINALTWVEEHRQTAAGGDGQKAGAAGGAGGDWGNTDNNESSGGSRVAQFTLRTDQPLSGPSAQPLREAKGPNDDLSPWKILESELKYLYVAFTRARTRLWIFDEGDDEAGPASGQQSSWTRVPVFEFLQRTGLVEPIYSGAADELRRHAASGAVSAGRVEVFARPSTPMEHLEAAVGLAKKAAEQGSWELYMAAADKFTAAGKPAEALAHRGIGLAMQAEGVAYDTGPEAADNASRLRLQAAQMLISAIDSGASEPRRLLDRAGWLFKLAGEAALSQACLQAVASIPGRK